MAESQKRTIGKLETWEAEDKSFSKHLLSEGVGETTPSDGSVCTVLINFIDNIEVPDHKLGGYLIAEEIEVTIGEGDTPLAELFDKVICSMKEKETSYIKAKIDVDGKKFESGSATTKNTVPSLSQSLGGESLKFNVILKSFCREADISELEVDEKLEKAQHHKDKGTELFKRHHTDFAVKRYLKANRFLEHLDKVEDLPEVFREQAGTLRVQCYNNLGACYLKDEKFEDVLTVEGQALSLEPGNVKALFRRGQAYFKLNNYPEAKRDFEACLQGEPNNAAVRNLLRDLEGKIKKERDMYAKMFKSQS